jgi:spoIIIJ-associated protein
MTDSTETSPATTDAEDTSTDLTTDATTEAPEQATGGSDAADEATDQDEDADEDAGDDDATGAAATGSRRKPSVQRLEEEGDVAADYLEELLDILDLDGDIDIDVENGRAAVSVVADPGSERALKRLVGTDGEVLEALQELTRLAVQTSTGERTRLMLDVAGFRAARREELVEVATVAVEKVKGGEEKVALEPMSPFERKVVHDTVAAAGLRSESEGEDARRHVVVLPA